MPDDEKLALLRRVLDGFNAHDLDAILEDFDETCVFESPRGPDPLGPPLRRASDEVRDGLGARFTSIPDVHYGSERRLRRRAIEACRSGRSTGTTVDGERIEVRGCDLWTFQARPDRPQGLVLEDRRAMKLVTFGDGQGGSGCSTARRSPSSTSRRCASGSSGAGRTRRASASRWPRRGCARRSCRRSSSTRPGTSASTRRSRRRSAGRTRSRRGSSSSRTSTRSSGPDEPVIYPEHLTEELDYELELAVVARRRPGSGSRRRRRWTTSAATSSSTTSPRATSSGGEMSSGVFSFCKAIDTFCPLGPWIVTPDEIVDPHDLAMQLRVNGEVRQESHSSRMSVTIPEILSRTTRPSPTRPATCSRPARCPAWPGSSRPRSARSLYLKPGDVIEREIEGIGVLRNPVISWQQGHGTPAAAADPPVG